MKIKDRNRKKEAIAAAILAAQREVVDLQEEYFGESYELGLRAADDMARLKREITTVTAAQRLQRLGNQEQEHIGAWFDDVRTQIEKEIDGDFEIKAAAIAAVGAAAMSKAWRSAGYSQATHRIAFYGYKEEMMGLTTKLIAEGLRIEAIFTAFPEADVIETSCFGCPGAVAGNPYTPSSVPSPGDFECLTNCRHEIAYRKKQII